MNIGSSYLSNRISLPNPITGESSSDESEVDCDMSSLELFCNFESEAPVYVEEDPDLLWKGSQLKDTGPVNSRTVYEYLLTLNRVKAAGVRFLDQPRYNYVEGGTCSAMALRFIKEYIQEKDAGSKKAKNIILQIQGLFRTSSEEFRNIQFAFNLIARDKKEPCTDFRKAKMESLAAFYELKVTDPSKTMDFDNDDRDTIIDKIRKYLDTFQTGTFLIRTLNVDSESEASLKEEAYGHSLVLIKEKNKQFFYNPDTGCRRLVKEKEAESLFNGLSESHKTCITPECRIYKVSLTG